MKKENKLGNKIREFRKNMGYTQAQLAEFIGTDDKHLSKIENGIYLPTYKTLKKLSEVLNFNFQDIDSDYKNLTGGNKIYQKALKILNSAKTDKELNSYLNALKLVAKILDDK